MYDNPNQPPQPPYGQQPYGQPQQPPYPYGQPYGSPQQPYPPPYGAPPPTDYGQPVQKKRGRKLWVILAIVVVVLVLACAGGIAAFVLAVNNSPAKATAQQYYDAIQGQDYNKAYSYLDSTDITVDGQPLTQQVYSAQARIRDAQKGKVGSYSINSINLNSSTSSGNTASITVHVTRNGASYDVHLGLRQEGNDWKITSIDDI